MFPLGRIISVVWNDFFCQVKSDPKSQDGGVDFFRWNFPVAEDLHLLRAQKKSSQKKRGDIFFVWIYIYIIMNFKTIWIFETIMYIIYSPQNKYGSPENGGPLGSLEIPNLETIRFHGEFRGCDFENITFRKWNIIFLKHPFFTYLWVVLLVNKGKYAILGDGGFNIYIYIYIFFFFENFTAILGDIMQFYEYHVFSHGWFNQQLDQMLIKDKSSQFIFFLADPNTLNTWFGKERLVYFFGYLMLQRYDMTFMKRFQMFFLKDATIASVFYHEKWITVAFANLLQCID